MGWFEPGVEKGMTVTITGKHDVFPEFLRVAEADWAFHEKQLAPAGKYSEILYC